MQTHARLGAVLVLDIVLRQLLLCASLRHRARLGLRGAVAADDQPSRDLRRVAPLYYRPFASRDNDFNAVMCSRMLLAVEESLQLAPLRFPAAQRVARLLSQISP